MIWLSWRRHRMTTLVVLGSFVLIGLWMAWIGHVFESKPTAEACRFASCGIWNGPFAYGRQAAIVDVLLLFMPCLVGLVLGTPLVAGELGQHTNRLAWTQSISRRRWLMTKVLVVGLPFVTAVAVVTLIAQWWTTHVDITVMPNVLENLRDGRILPSYFGITGIVPVAYTLFAFALGACLGAVIRRTGWAVVGTVVIYGVLALVMVFAIRPSLAPRYFVQAGHSAPQAVATAWRIGDGYRFAPGTTQPATTPSADVVGQLCQDRNFSEGPYLGCLARHHLQYGTFYQPAANYWTLQWRESAIYAGLAVLGFAVASSAVRRWRG